MRIKYIKIENCKRFPFLESNVFEYTFDSKITNITGVNGSGKSNLLSELTPLPSDKNSYYKNGYKEIHIDHDGKSYVLICDFKEGSKYSFLVNGVEENHANIVTAQKDLCFLHFNITPSVHDILTGLETFTNMSLLARKKLFATITHLNIDKVIENFNSLKEQHKTNEFLLKSQTNQYQTEEQKLINSNHLDNLRDNLTRTKNHMDLLLDLRTNLYAYIRQEEPEQVYLKLKQIQEKLKSTLDKHYIYITAYPKGNLQDYTVKYNTDYSLVKYQLEELYKLIESQQNELKTLDLVKQSNLENLLLKKKEHEQSIARHTNSLVFIKDITINTQTVKSSIYRLEVSLPEILRTIPISLNNGITKKYSKESYDRLVHKKRELLSSITELSSQEHSVSKEIKELSQTSDNITCPKCTHTWSLKDIPTTLINLNKLKQEILGKMEELQTNIKALDKQIEDFIFYFDLYKQYSVLRNSTYEDLQHMWNTVDSNSLIFNNPTAIIPFFNQVTSDVSSIEEINKLQEELKTIDKNISLLNDFKDVSYKDLEDNLGETGLAIEDLQSYKNTLSERLKSLERVTALYSYLEKLQSLLDASKDLMQSFNTSLLAKELTKLIDIDLTKHKVILIETEKELHHYNTIQYTMDRYKKDIEDTTTNLKVLKIVLDELSPKNGLIAKSVSSFLNTIIVNMNKTINSVWSYKMILKPIDVEYDSLNYKFKLEVEDKLSVPDVNLASAGMKEVINLSFKLVLYRLLDLYNYPLVFDELASAMDSNHTEKVSTLVQQLSTHENFSQLFIVTHKENISNLRNMSTVSLS